MSRYQIVPLEAGILEQAAELNRWVHGGTRAQQKAYLEWKYLRNPYVSEPLGYVAVHERRVIGMRCLYGLRWRFGASEKTYDLPAAAESGILDEFRDQGLFGALHDALLEDAGGRGYTHVLNLSATPQVSMTSMLTFGWKGVLPYDVMALGRTESEGRRGQSIVRRLVPLRVRDAAARLVRSRTASRTVSAFDRRFTFRSATSLVRVADSYAVLADVASRSGEDEGIQLVRDETFFRWRLENPLASYRFLIAEGDEGCGFLIVGAMPHQLPAFILEWRAASSSIKEALLAAILQGGGLKNVAIWSATLTREDVATLASRGLVPVEPRSSVERRRKALLVRPIKNPEEHERWALDGVRLDEAGSWNLGALASDAY